MMKIPFLKPLLPDVDEYNKKVKEVFESYHFTNKGKQHEQLELELKQYLGTDNLSLFVNGHLSLESILEVFDLKGEIITTAFTFPSTIHAIVRKGCIPVFCDIKDDLTIDESKVESLITDRTVAILPVHVLGNICNVEALEKIAKLNDLKLIFDAAHVFGVKYKSKDVSSFGDANMYSMNITKVFNTIEGGIVTVKDNKYLEKLELIKYFGMRNGDVTYIGSNLKMNEMQAIMGLLTLPLIENDVTMRKIIFNKYIKGLSHLPITFFQPQKDVEPNYIYFSILLENQMVRDDLSHYLLDLGIETKKYFFPIASEYTCYKDKYLSNHLKKSMDLASRIVNLPIFALLKDDEIDFIIQSINNYFKI